MKAFGYDLGMDRDQIDKRFEHAAKGLTRSGFLLLAMFSAFFIVAVIALLVKVL